MKVDRTQLGRTEREAAQMQEDCGGVGGKRPGGGNRRGVFGKSKVPILTAPWRILCRRAPHRRTRAGQSVFLLNTDQAGVRDRVMFHSHLS